MQGTEILREILKEQKSSDFLTVWKGFLLQWALLNIFTYYLINKAENVFVIYADNMLDIC